MRKLLKAGGIFFISMLFLLPPVTAGPRGRAPGRPTVLGPYVPDEVLVQFKRGIRADIAAAAVGARVHAHIQDLDVYVLKVPEGTVEATILAFTHNPLVEYAEPNGYVQTFNHQDPNDPYDNPASCPYLSSDGSLTCQWFWGKVQAYDAWHLTTGNCTIRVAVVDTGIDVGDPAGLPPDAAHPDLHACGNTLVRSFVSGEGGNDDNGHGTHVAGVIGARTNNGVGVAGANWQSQLMGVKVLNFLGSGTWSQVASGINWAANNGAKVINLSLGGSGGSKTLRNAVNNAWNKGAVLVCAAGNSGSSAPSYPAFYANCIAVAATDRNDVKPSWSTFGTWVDVAAPGVQILSTTQDTWEWCFLCWGQGYFEGYDSLSGTSMATSVVSGLAALIWASGLCTTNTCVRNRIESKADPIPGTGTLWAKGRVNFLKSLTP